MLYALRRTWLTLVMMIVGVGFLITATGQRAQADCADMLITDPTEPAFLTSNNIFIPNGQNTLNCYAWQMFLSLNWPVHPDWPATSAKAGEPDRTATIATIGVPENPDMPMTGATVWESFKPATEIFLPNAKTPSDWGVLGPIDPACQTLASVGMAQGRFSKTLSAGSKSAVNSAHRFNLSSGTLDTQSDEIMEATGGWLTDQNGNLVFFERLVGKAEFDYIMQHGLYDAANQLALATNADGKNPDGFVLPAGQFFRGSAPAKIQAQEDLGSFELKAAWKTLTGQTQEYKRYLTTTAYLINPKTGVCTREVVGLVGLHILHKTPTFIDFLWTTFEHVDNVPAANAPLGGTYSFNNPSCKTCIPNAPRIECIKDGTCKDLFPRDEPVQVTRVNTQTQAILDLNNGVQKMLAEKTNGKSVFQYYQFVNILWDGSPAQSSANSGPKARVPITFGTFSSQSNLKVANTTMETYAQTDNCDDCHKFATIAGSQDIPSNFSFLFGDASSAKSPELITHVKEALK